MDTKDFTGLLSILKFALILCGALIIMGNMGIFSSMPIMIKNPLTSQMHFDYIHILYYLAFNCLFVGFLSVYGSVSNTLKPKRVLTFCIIKRFDIPYSQIKSDSL
ncbi:putative membrane protein [Photobacterium leiognathi lrivu.4.1]|uniref:Putative membrane protein n=1 Tax=Photobacterium leiognathi lrivu.4.1 TaxID=1248232 RepID=A0A0U1P6M3_PHOLE|nr:hypothetical protein [Photobacterium leiognathi]GAD30014.1 putative membrane protein [Photobacterium leiognathi lrivu.4.1]